MVEVFKTDVYDEAVADQVVDLIQKTFIHYKANFDLSDCDNILRVECEKDSIHCIQLIEFLKELNVEAEVLPD